MSARSLSRTTASPRRSRPAAAVALLAALLAAGLLLTGCAAPGARQQSDGFASEPGFSGGAPSQVEEGDASGGGADGQSERPASDREVIVTGSLYLTVEAPLEAADEAASIVEEAGGRIDGRREYAPRAGARAAEEGGTMSDDAASYAPDEYPYGYGYGFPGDGGGAVLELRIPTEKLTGTLEKLKALGKLEELQLSSDDVTVEVRDIDARITALRSSIGRLLALQDDAAAVEDLIALETAISNRQAELESLESQQRYYADHVSLSTIVLTLGSEDVAPIDEPDTFWTGVVAGWEALVGFVGGLLVITGVLLPWLAVLGVLALVAWAVVRRARRRGRGTSDGVVNGAVDGAAASPVTGTDQPGGPSGVDS